MLGTQAAHTRGVGQREGSPCIWGQVADCLFRVRASAGHRGQAFCDTMSRSSPHQGRSPTLKWLEVQCRTTLAVRAFSKAKADRPLRQALAKRMSYIEQLLHVVQQALGNRATAATGMNAVSSRSHCLVFLTIQRRLLTSSRRSDLLTAINSGEWQICPAQARTQPLPFSTCIPILCRFVHVLRTCISMSME